MKIKAKIKLQNVWFLFYASILAQTGQLLQAINESRTCVDYDGSFQYYYSAHMALYFVFFDVEHVETHFQNSLLFWLMNTC